MSFDTDGFLDNQVNEIIKENYELHKDIFNLCEDINRYAQEIKYNLNINSNNFQGIVATSIFIKILNIFQSVVILYKYGLDSQSKILTRTAIESLFVLKCIVKDEKYVEWLINSDNKKREQLLRRIQENPHGVFNSLIDKVDISQLNALIKENKIKKIKVIDPKEWAEASESYTEYYYAYKFLCGDVHVDIRNIEQYITANNEGSVEQFNILSNENDIKIILGHTANYVMLEAIECMSEFAALNNETMINYFEKRIKELG